MIKVFCRGSIYLVYLLLTPFTWAQAASLSVTINHRQGVQNPVAQFELKEGETLQVEVTNTNLDCFEFNQRSSSDQRDAALAAGDLTPDNVQWDIIHDGDTSKYIVEAKKRPDPSESCGEVFKLLSERTWEIQVATYGWSVGFGGAFTIDKLTNPVFSLTPGSRTDASGNAEQGFLVTVDDEAGDDYRLGAAATVHLFHSDPEFLGRAGVAWVPLSFGLGVGESSRARYFVGTGVRFDTRLFLSIGRVFGSVERLPNGLRSGSFTTSENALSTLGSRTDDAWFVSLSYNFMDIDLSPFGSPFKAQTPAPDELNKE